MKQKDLSEVRISIGQISNIETGLQMPSAEKFITLLGKMNVGYREFLYIMNDDYLTIKEMMSKQLDEFVRLRNIKGLENLAKEASNFLNNYGDMHFQHINLISLAMAELLKSNNNYENAKRYLLPIKEYLDNIDEWGLYELTLISRCLFIFDITVAISFGERALKLIEKSYLYYKSEKIASVLLINLAIYLLDYQDYYQCSLKYSKMGIGLATKTNDATKVLQAKVVYQVACFKLENGLFSKAKLLAFIKVFDLLEWNKEYDDLKKFIQKHGISLNE